MGNSDQPEQAEAATQTQGSNVIDLNLRRSARSGRSQTVGAAARVDMDPVVVDMVERREAILNAERRELKRTILTEFVGAFVLVPNAGLVRSAIYDISDNGIAFDLDLGSGSFSVGDQVAMRVYLNQFTFFPFVVAIANARTIPDEGVVRHGCHFIKDTTNHEALHHFVKFIETVSASLRTDHGDVMISQRI